MSPNRTTWSHNLNLNKNHSENLNTFTSITVVLVVNIAINQSIMSILKIEITDFIYLLTVYLTTLSISQDYEASNGKMTMKYLSVQKVSNLGLGKKILYLGGYNT